LALELSRMPRGTPRRLLSSVIGEASALSQSVGETRTRAVVRQLGFPPPTLQFEVVDAEGSMYGDLAWPKFRVILEFDGRMKYTRDEYTGGDPATVVWREKRREDRLRRLGWTIVRVVWADLERPSTLAGWLEAAGLSRGGS